MVVAFISLYIQNFQIELLYDNQKDFIFASVILKALCNKID